MDFRKADGRSFDRLQPQRGGIRKPGTAVPGDLTLAQVIGNLRLGQSTAPMNLRRITPLRSMMKVSGQP